MWESAAGCQMCTAHIGLRVRDPVSVCGSAETVVSDFSVLCSTKPMGSDLYPPKRKKQWFVPPSPATGRPIQAHPPRLDTLGAAARPVDAHRLAQADHDLPSDCPFSDHFAPVVWRVSRGGISLEPAVASIFGRAPSPSLSPLFGEAIVWYFWTCRVTQRPLQ